LRLNGKTRDEIEAALTEKTRAQLLDLIHELATFDRLLTAGQVAACTRKNKREVLAAMKAGRFVDPIFGAGFFCLAANSFRVSITAANAWRRSFFVPVDAEATAPVRAARPSRMLSPHKKKIGARRQNGVDGGKLGQRAPRDAGAEPGGT